MAEKIEGATVTKEVGYVCVHAHFYQPPRENPWLDEVEREPSADPYHDWNSRITAECYRANGYSRILEGHRITDIVNNYTNLSFNFGPTLLYWMERKEPEVYRMILEADRRSVMERDGHGNAIAQVYNHSIMPLNSRHDKETQILWGIGDFTHRFGREPEGLWLAETAVDSETLRIAADLGIKYVILAPGQAKQVKHLIEGSEWKDAKEALDTTRPYLFRTGGERDIVLFFYDGVIAHEVAFKGALHNGYELARTMVKKLERSLRPGGLLHIATDGETFGHHHRFGEMGLSALFKGIEKTPGVEITNYGQYLALRPPVMEVEIVENSSWSCFHGVERWKSDCGCSVGGRHGWNQKWRGPMRAAFDRLKGSLDSIFETEGARYLKDPWSARNAYIEVILDRSAGSVAGFLKRYALRDLTHGEKVSVMKLMEMQASAMKMYTSCGWFFAEVSGLEPVQDMKYAAHAIHLASHFTDDDLEDRLIADLSEAKSNLARFADGGHVFVKFVKKMKKDRARVAARTAIASCLGLKPETSAYCFTIKQGSQEYREYSGEKLLIGSMSIASRITFEEIFYDYCLLHTGGHEFVFSYRLSPNGEGTPHGKEVLAAFEAHSLPDVFSKIEKKYGERRFTFDDLFEADRKLIVERLTETVIGKLRSVYGDIFKEHAGVMGFFREIGEPVPEEFALVAKYVLEKKLIQVFDASSPNVKEMSNVFDKARIWGIKPDYAGVSKKITSHIIEKIDAECGLRKEGCTRPVLELFKVCRARRVRLDDWRLQNTAWPFYRVLREEDDPMFEFVMKEKPFLELFDRLGFYLPEKLAVVQDEEEASTSE